VTFRVLPAVIMGRDDRNDAAAKNTGSKYRGVGYVQCDDNKAATASLIYDSRAILTVAHFFFTNTGESIHDLSGCWFYITDDGGYVLEQSKIVSVLAYGKRDVSNYFGRHKDMLVAKLQKTIQLADAFAITPYKPAINEPVRICSYSDDLPDNTIKRCVLGRIRNFGNESVSADNSMVVLHDANVQHASSGAPLFSLTHDKVIYGMHNSVMPPDENGNCGKEDCPRYDVNQRFNEATFFTDEFIDFVKSYLGAK